VFSVKTVVGNRKQNIYILGLIYFLKRRTKGFKIAMFFMRYRLPGSLFDPEKGGSMFLRNVGKIIPYYTAFISQKTILFNF
jgi:hypothetical protein